MTAEKVQPGEVSLLPTHDGGRELPEVGQVPRGRVDNDRGSHFRRIGFISTKMHVEPSPHGGDERQGRRGASSTT